MYQTDMYEGMLAETVTMHGASGDVAALASTVGMRRAALRQRHFPF